MSYRLLDELVAVADEPPDDGFVRIAGNDPVFPLWLRVGEAGAASIAATGLAAARLWQLRTGRMQEVRVEVDAAAAAMRSNRYLKWQPPPDDNASGLQSNPASPGDMYLARDGRWVYLHRFFAHHRARIASVLDGADDAESLERAISAWDAVALEDAVHAAGACGGMVRTATEWRAHEQARAIEALPLFEIRKIGASAREPLPAGDRPLAGVRVLDLTRVLAGPTCARTLAEHGADVLRIGNARLPNNDDLQILDTGHGKRSTVLDLTSHGGADTLWSLVRGADVFSQSYRPGSLEGKGFGVEELAEARPGIIVVTLSAFSHAGPWRVRRGFDTLVQAVSGIAERYGRDGRPRLLPVSALDYITGYLAAFGVMVALRRRAQEGGSYEVRLSLAQTGRWLTRLDPVPDEEIVKAAPDLPPERIEQLSTTTDSVFGPLTHLAPIVQLSETPARWERPAVPLDHDPPEWLQRG